MGHVRTRDRLFLCGARSVAILRQNMQVAAIPLKPEVVAEPNHATQPLADALGPSFDYWQHPANDGTV